MLDVREIEPCDTEGHGASARGPCAMRGGARLSVIGTLAQSAMGEWRAGRELLVAASLREPTVYRNPGVPDERRALARRGVALVGSVKSAAMVDVVSRASPPDEWASAFRAWVRSVLAATVAPWSDRSAGVAAAIAIGDRTGLAEDDEERLQAAGTYHVIAISGGNIAILTLIMLGAGALAWGPATTRRSRRDRRAAGVWSGHRTSAVRRPRDRRRRPVSCRSPARTAWSVDQHPGSRRNPRPVAIAHGCIRPWLSAVVWRDARHFDRRPEAGLLGEVCFRTQNGPPNGATGEGRAPQLTRGFMARRERAGSGGRDDRRRDRADADCRFAIRACYLRWPAPQPGGDSADDRRPGGVAGDARRVVR